MSRWRLTLAILLVAITGSTFGATRAIAQPKPRPSASASASASAGPAPSAAPAATASAAPAPSALPAGHPAGQRGDEEDEPGALKPDLALEDPALPVGTIVVTIKDGAEAPVPHSIVTLAVTHNTVAKGESTETQTREADETGSVRFDGMPRGSSNIYRVSTKRGAATYVLPEFGLTERGGKRGVLHSFEASATLDANLMVVMRGAIGVTLREDAIEVQQLITVVNAGRIAWLADMPMKLPAGFKAFNKQETIDDARIEEVPGTGAALRGTFPPGQRDIEFHYQVPLEGDATQSIHIQLPQRTTQARVIAEASKTMGLEVRGFPPARRVESRDGKRILITDLAAKALGEASSIDITLTGLPTHGPGRWIAVALAVLALASGIAYFAQSPAGKMDVEGRRDLADAREALLGELVALERAHQVGEVGPKTYERVRASLLDALARIVAMIEAAAPPPVARRGKPARKPARHVEDSA